MSEKTFYDENGNVIKRVFTIPVGDLSREDAEKQIKDLMNSYTQEIDLPEGFKLPIENFSNLNSDIWFPVKDPERTVHISEDIWNELSTSEKKERLLPENEQKISGFMDWNKLSLDQHADYLEEKYRFSSKGEALSIYKLIEFYRQNKDKV